MKIVGVIGAAEPEERLIGIAEEIGRLLAKRGAVVVTGGLGGVMEAASRGAYLEGGITVGILPGFSKEEANPYVKVPIPTGLGEIRNTLIVRASDVLIAVGGGYGTLSEIAFALKSRKRVIGVETWKIEGVIEVNTANEAVKLALE